MKRQRQLGRTSDGGWGSGPRRFTGGGNPSRATAVLSAPLHFTHDLYVRKSSYTVKATVTPPSCTRLCIMSCTLFSP